MFHGRVHGLTVASEFSLPELASVSPPEGHVDVRISIADEPFGDNELVFSASDLRSTQVVLHWHGCSFRISRGAEIEVWESEDAERSFTRAVLLGIAFSVLLYQRGLWPLHVSSVGCDEGVWLFSGPSGTGKSTLAILLHALYGFEHVCDDMGAAQVTPTGVRFSSGLKSVRLLPDSLSFLKEKSDAFLESVDQIASFDEKTKICLPKVDNHLPRLVKGLIVLRDGVNGEPAAINALHGVQAMQAVREAIYRPLSRRFFTTAADTLSFCGRFVQTVSVHEYRRSRVYEQCGAELAPLLGLLRS